MAKLPFGRGAYLFAPMEGVTSASYRQLIRQQYPLWDALCADFIRIPSTGCYPTKFLISHIGEELLLDQHELSRTMVQILTAPNCKTLETVDQLVDLGVQWLDLNIGCPSGTVVKRRGGSYWLKCVDELKNLLTEIRCRFPHLLTVKMRVGFSDASNFVTLLKTIEDCSVDAITVHARTREQLYKEKANWNFIKLAVETVNIPIIGNGDLWNPADAQKMLKETGCYGVMIARGALKSPWFHQLGSTFSLTHNIQHYFQLLNESWGRDKYRDQFRIKKIKEFSRYLFEDLDNGEQIRRKILLSSSLREQFSHLAALSTH